MNSFINYILESGISLGALSLIYFVFLRHETFFKTNRLFLLFAVVFSSLLPLLHFKIYGSGGVVALENSGATNMLEAITVSSSAVSNSLIGWISASQVIIGGYFTIAGLMALVVAWRIYQLVRVIRQGELVSKHGINYVYIDDNSSPYSFLDYLFVSRNLETKPGWEKMLAHECEHIRQGHTVDILILELISIIQWFNPFFWLLRRVIKENHEYMADQAVLNKGVAINHYKEILVTQFIGEQFSIANNFNSSLIKSRLKMMTKIKSSKKANFRYLIGLMAAITLVLVFACENKEAALVEPESGVVLKSAASEQPLIIIDGELAGKETMDRLDPKDITSVNVVKQADDVYIQKYGDLAKNGVIEITLKSGAMDAQNTDVDDVVVVAYGNSSPESSDPVFHVVDEMPEFPGGELALRKFIARNIKYPVSAKENGVQGKVYVTFVVEKDGSVGRTKIARGVDTALDYEALRVINQSPKWTPGKHKGELVAVSFTVPINFVLE
ncbi:TonB family protein [uncultured Sunxiuqinia sp.]|uniref:TonB family protein n=1 Tax=uncultured Sunxiuqinia sp. TaxID=1573825 RepID=UPI0026125DCB|nr:TonB family protein [uncultured Sunxiuqinia sp.]